MWKKIKEWIKYLFTHQENNSTSEEAILGFDMYQMTEDGKNPP